MESVAVPSSLSRRCKGQELCNAPITAEAKNTIRAATKPKARIGCAFTGKNQLTNRWRGKIPLSDTLASQLVAIQIDVTSVDDINTPSTGNRVER